MSLMSMRRKMASKGFATKVLWVLVVVFLAGVFLWSVPPNRGTSAQDRFGNDENAKKVVAKVGGEDVLLGEVDLNYNREKEQAGRSFFGMTQPMDPSKYVQARKAAYTDAIEDHLLKIALKRLGQSDRPNDLKAVYTDNAKAAYQAAVKQAASSAKTDQERFDKETKENAAKPENERKEVVPAKSQDEYLKQVMQSYAQSLGKQGGTIASEKEFINLAVEQQMTKDEDGQNAKFARIQLLGQAIAKQLPVNPLSDQYIEKLYTKDVKASWIFIPAEKKAEGTNVANLGAATVPDMTPAGLDAAKTKAAETRQAIVDGIGQNANIFADKAKAESSDMMTKLKGGDLEWVQPGKGTLPLMAEYLAYTTDPVGISPIMEMPFQNAGRINGLEVGYAIVKVDQIRDRVEDAKTSESQKINWANDKADLLTQTRQRYSYQLGKDYIDSLKYEYPVTPVTEEAKWVMGEQQGTLLGDELNAAYQAVVDDASVNIPDEVRGALNYMLAQTKTTPEEKIKYLELSFAGAGDKANDIHQQVADLYLSTLPKRNADEKKAAINSALENLGYVLPSLNQSVTDKDQDYATQWQLRSDLLKSYTQIKAAYAEITGVSPDHVKDVDTQVATLSKWLEANKEPAPTPSGMGGGMPFNLNLGN